MRGQGYTPPSRAAMEEVCRLVWGQPAPSEEDLQREREAIAELARHRREARERVGR